MIKDVVNHQIALLNLGSSDVNYALKSNFPFYIEQKDQRAGGQPPEERGRRGRHGDNGRPGGVRTPTSRSARRRAGPTT